ncbi:MAG: hypothetical protein HC899_11005 [Leptolyngbyaceae cyanobacterium SM1_4_3]|nr:hypothetical protein [Leptolyngbyaceae cyanobacterium SM1_4_3]
MSALKPSFCQTVSMSTFQQLQELLQQMVHVTEVETLVLTESSTVLEELEQSGVGQFTLVVSKPFSALLWRVSPAEKNSFQDKWQTCQFNLTFEPERSPPSCISLAPCLTNRPFLKPSNKFLQSYVLTMLEFKPNLPCG